MWYSGARLNTGNRIGYATSPIVTGIDDNILFNIPQGYLLSQNYPNPFNPTTKINYELPITNYVDLSIYNILGRRVTTLVSQQQKTGLHQVEWDATGFASGLYYYRIEAGNFIETRKMIYLK
jgi:hypothetical protein